MNQTADIPQMIGGRIDADHGIAAPIKETVQNRSSNAPHVISWMVWLETC